MSRVRNIPDRRDVAEPGGLSAFRASRVESQPRRRRLTEPTVDTFGRFIGPQDIERGIAHFWNAPHRRGSAPIARADPVFAAPSKALPQAGQGGPGKARQLRIRGLTLDNLRALHQRHRAGASVAQLAREAGVGYQTLMYHLRGSPSLHAALRAG